MGDRVHNLKIGDGYLSNLIRGVKKSEVRLNDRDYQPGDYVRFVRDCLPSLFEITHIHSGLGMAANYVVLSLRLIEDAIPLDK